MWQGKAKQAQFLPHPLFPPPPLCRPSEYEQRHKAPQIYSEVDKIDKLGKGERKTERERKIEREGEGESSADSKACVCGAKFSLSFNFVAFGGKNCGTQVMLHSWLWGD